MVVLAPSKVASVIWSARDSATTLKPLECNSLMIFFDLSYGGVSLSSMASIIFRMRDQVR